MAKLYPCKECGKLVPIRSKGLCPSCRYKQRKEEGSLPDYSKPKTKKPKDEKVIEALEKLNAIRKISQKNTYTDSYGNKYTKQEVNNNISKAKEEKLKQFYDIHGYYFCEDCGINAQNSFKLECSHNVSVKKCQELGKIELAWDVNNIKLRCHNCHLKHD